VLSPLFLIEDSNSKSSRLLLNKNKHARATLFFKPYSAHSSATNIMDRQTIMETNRSLRTIKNVSTTSMMANIPPFSLTCAE
jgi:hypothetical protein